MEIELSLEDCNAIINSMEQDIKSEIKEEKKSEEPFVDPLDEQIKEQFVKLIDNPFIDVKPLSELLHEQTIKRREEFAQCVECGLEAKYFCDRCDVQFCAVHFEPHIKSKQCVVCKEILCFDQFSEDNAEQRDECFRCFVKNQFTVLRRSMNSLKF